MYVCPYFNSWSREKALSYMKENSGLSEERSNKEIDRYATVPAQVSENLFSTQIQGLHFIYTQR